MAGLGGTVYPSRLVSLSAVLAVSLSLCLCLAAGTIHSELTFIGYNMFTLFWCCCLPGCLAALLASEFGLPGPGLQQLVIDVVGVAAQAHTHPGATEEELHRSHAERENGLEHHHTPQVAMALLSNVIVVGGTAELPGLAERLQQEVAALARRPCAVGAGRREFSEAEAAATACRVPCFGGSDAVWHGASLVAASAGVALHEATWEQRMPWVGCLQAVQGEWLERCRAVRREVYGATS